MTDAYRRRPRSPFRVIDGNVLIGGVGHETIGIGGAATFIWLVLDQPRTTAHIAAEIAATWPELGAVDNVIIDEALTLLVDRRLVEVVAGESAQDEPLPESTPGGTAEP